MHTIYRSLFIGFTGLFVLLFSVNLFAQKETNFWFFGTFAGLNFNSGAPVPDTNGILSTNEGCATISNANGELLFYTSGNRVYNRNHIQMPNGFGLAGDTSSSQAAVIAPLPGSATTYYIFTVDEEGGTLGFRYSVVDLNLQGGLGDISVKNALLLPVVSEKVTAVKHNNNFDIWIITHEWDSDAFYAYLLTAAGISPTPVISNVGLVHTGGSIAPNGNSAGYMKASPIGNKLALAIKEMNLFEIFDFNSATGVVSNPITTSATYTNAYGVEFSPDGSKLYGSIYGFGSPRIFQFNLQAPTPAAILSSATQVATSASTFGGALQLASDGKIYFSRHQSQWLGVINNPNTLGVACGYADDGVFLGGLTANFGLPNFVQSYLKPTAFSFQNTCFGNATQFTLLNTAFVTDVLWNFNNPASGSNNTSTQFNPLHTFTAPGLYTVSLTVTLTNGVQETTEQNVLIHSLLTGVNLGADQLLCSSDTLLLAPNVPGAISYLWQNGSAAPTFTVTQAGTYSVTVSNICNSVSDAITLTFTQPPTIDIGSSQTLCTGQTLQLNATPTNGALNTTFQWETGETTPTYTVSSTGFYSVIAGNQCGTTTDIVFIDFLEPPVINLGQDLILCEGLTTSLSAVPDNQLLAGAVNYLWQNGSTQPTLNIANPGTYSVTVTNQCGSASDALTLTHIFPPVVNLGSDASLCPGETLTLNAATPDGIYLWQDGSAAPTFTVTEPGNYWVQVANLCGVVFDEVNVSYQTLLPPNLGPDTTLCPGQTLTLSAATSGVSYLWQDGSTASSFTASVPGIYWVQIANNCSAATDSVTVSFGINPTIDLGEDVTLCDGETLNLNISIPDAQATYQWNNGNTTPNYTLTAPGIYTATVTNQCGLVSDTLAVTYLSAPQVNLGNDAALCPGETLTLNATTPNAQTYLWQNGSNQPTLTVANAGIYSVQVTNACGAASDTLTVTLGSNLSINLGNNQTLCNNQTLTLQATTPGVTYLWQNGSSAGTYTVTEPGAYWVQIANNCSTATDTIVIQYQYSPTLALPPDTTLCPGETLLLSAQQPDDLQAVYLWQDGSSTPTLPALQEGLYWVQATNFCGTATDSVQITIAPLPVVSVSGITNFCLGESVTLTAVAANATSIVWQNGNTTPSITITQSDTYQVTAANQCATATAALTVQATDCTPPEPLPCTLLVPNAFSPNQDGQNDLFGPVYNCPTNYAYFAVYNRWGEKVFETNSLQDHWNGVFKNTNCPAGVYVWLLQYQNPQNQTQQQKGNVTLLR